MPRMSAEQIAGALGQAAMAEHFVFPSDQDAITMIAIALAESTGDSDAKHTNVDGTIDEGLWQINSDHTEFDRSRLFDPVYNATAALDLYKRNKFKDWTPQTYPLRSAPFIPAATTAWNAITLDPSKGYHSPGFGDLSPGVPGLPSPQNAISEGLKTLGAVTKWVANGHNWVRVAEVFIGGALVIAGLTAVAANSKTVSTVRKVVP